MSRSSAVPPLRRLRTALLLAIAGLLAGLVALFWVGRAARPRPRPVATETAPGQPAPESADAAVLSEGFDYEQQVDGRPVFRLRGDRFSTDREGRVALEGVHLSLFREGEPLEVRSRRATYEPESQVAQLEGEVRLSSASGWELETERLELEEGGRVATSRGDGVRFRRGASLAGSARALRYDSEHGEMELSREVEVRGAEAPGEPPLHLTCDRMLWRRDDRVLLAQVAVQLDSGADRLRAEKIVARLTEDEKRLRAVSAEGGAHGKFATAPGEALAFAAERIDLELDPDSGAPRAAELRQREAAAVPRLEMASAGAPSRTVTAPKIDVAWEAGQLAKAAASGGVTLEEAAAAGAPPRLARARRLAVKFTAGGTLESARFEDEVTLEDGLLVASGEVAVLEEDAQRARLRGKPAVARDDRGQLSAPQLLYDRAAGRVEAQGGVQAVFRQEASPLAGSAASASGPVHVDAERGSFGVGDRSFAFHGRVQAVRGDSMLFADQFAGNEATGTATAEGKVRSVWTDRTAPAAPAIPTTITAERMEYRRGAGEVIYSGAVTLRQQERELDASQITVELDEQRRARRMIAVGAVQIRDRSAGRSVAGERAVYDLASREAVVTGAPVEIREVSGAVLKGRRAVFDLDTGTARLAGESP